MEKRNILLWVAILMNIIGLWMFYVMPTIWWVDAVQRASWFIASAILIGIGLGILAVRVVFRDSEIWLF